MFKKSFILTILCISLGLFISCNDGFPFVSEMWEKSGRSGGGGSRLSSIVVKADSASKALNASDPPFTYTYSPDPLPDGVSLTGELSRDPGEIAGSYVIRQGTVSLTGVNASKYAIKYISNVFYIND